MWVRKAVAEGLAEQDVAIFSTFALLDPDLVILQVDLDHLDAAKFADSNACEEQQSQHQGVLNIVRLIDDLVEATELVGIQNTREAAALLGWLEVANLADMLRDVSPAVVVQADLANHSGHLGDQSSLLRFRFSVL